VLFQQIVEQRLVRGSLREQRQAGAEFEVVGGAEDLMRGSSFYRNNGFAAFAQARAQDRMGQIVARFLQRLDGVGLRHGAVAQPRDLWEDEPHPMRLLGAALKFAQRPRIDGRLGFDEALQAHTPAFFADTSPMAAQSLSCQPQATAWS